MVKAAKFVKSVCKRQLDFKGISVFGAIDFQNPRNSEFEISLPAFPRGIFGTRKVWPGPFALRVTGKPSVGFQLSIMAQFDKSKLQFMVIGTGTCQVHTMSQAGSLALSAAWHRCELSTDGAGNMR